MPRKIINKVKKIPLGQGRKGQPQKPLPPPGVLAKMRELKTKRTSLSRDELQYVVNAFDMYNKQSFANTGWEHRHEYSIRKRLFGTQENDGYQETCKDYLKHTSVLEYFNHINKKNGYLSPTHQKWLIDKMDYVCNAYNSFEERKLNKFRTCYTCPPRSSKTLLVYAWIMRLLVENPYLRIVYITNNDGNSDRCSATVRGYLKSIGTTFKTDINNKTEWVIEKVSGHTLDNIVCGGGLQCYTTMSVPQGISADVLIIDDLYANTGEADSDVKRNKINESFFSNMQTRLTQCGCILIVSTRYHEKDLIGILTDPNNNFKYEYKNLPAMYIGEKGQEQSYWPKYWDNESLRQVRINVGERVWQNLYMGNPRPKEDRLINDISRYEDLPSGGKYVYSIDLAYSEKTKADYSTIVKMYRVGDVYYVSEIQRWKQDIDLTLKRIKSIVGSSECHWSYGGTENAIITLAKEKYDLVIKGTRTNVDKYSRALPFASNISNIYFHKSIKQDIIDEILNFNGSGSGHDDVVDSCVTCYTVLSSSNKSCNNMSFNDANKMFSGIKLNSRLSFGSIDDDDD